MRKLLLILIILCTGCVSTGDMRDFTHGAARGFSNSVDSANRYELESRRIETREKNIEALNKLYEQLRLMQSQQPQQQQNLTFEYQLLIQQLEQQIRHDELMDAIDRLNHTLKYGR